MFHLFWGLAIRWHALFRAAPTNRLTTRFRARPTLTKAAAAAALSVGYLYAAAVCSVLLAGGAPGLLHVFVVLCLWNAAKLLALAVLMVAMRLAQYASKPRQSHPHTAATLARTR